MMENPLKTSKNISISTKNVKFPSVFHSQLVRGPSAVEKIGCWVRRGGATEAVGGALGWSLRPSAKEKNNKRNQKSEEEEEEDVGRRRVGVLGRLSLWSKQTEKATTKETRKVGGSRMVKGA